jgi:alkylation response protein AidB-like acyl-CoA dehydrogenase
MATPGVTVRPLAEIVKPEHPDLNEVFFSDVVVPRENLVGQMNNGWAMANGSLAHERGMVWLSGVLALEDQIEAVLTEAPAALGRLAPAQCAVVSDGLVQSAIDVAAARCLGYRGFAKLVRGGSAPEQALMKVFSSEARQRLSLRAAEMGADRLVDLGPTPGDHTWIEDYFVTFGGTISAGSSEIQRNIIAEKVLGLPR